MPIQSNWFPGSAFNSERKQISVIALESQQRAVAYLRTLIVDHSCVPVLLGQKLSGKSVIVQQFVAGLRSNTAVATVDGTGLSPDKLLSQTLLEFGYEMATHSADDLLRMLRIFLVQQTRTCPPPIIIVENIEKMLPATLRTLCLISTFMYQGEIAARLVLTGRFDTLPLLDSSGMTAISKRIEPAYEVEAITRPESTIYLQGRLTDSGIVQPETILPVNVCNKIYDGSEGLPGRLNEIALRTLEQALVFPASVADVEKQEEIRKMEHSIPKLVITLNGEKIEEYLFKENKVTIGRSNLADIVIHDEYASKFHLLLLQYLGTLVLIDLNSANGTFVNSVRVQSTLLKSDDIVSLATYRIKILNVPEPESIPKTDASHDTRKLQTLDDMREQRKAQFPYLEIRRRYNL